MNICILSKFPPLEGGIAAKTYWLAKAYVRAGHKVFVITNSGAADKRYIIKGCEEHLRGLVGIEITDVASAPLPWHIPHEPHSLARLLDALLGVIKTRRIDVVDTGYLIPCGMAAYLAHRLSGVPYVVRHGGSDIAKFLQANLFGNLLPDVLASAKKVVTDQASLETVSRYSSNTVVLPPYVPDPEAFLGRVGQQEGQKRFLYLGKINWHWERKGLDGIASWFSGSTPPGKMKWIGNGTGIASFRRMLRNSDIKAQRVHGFVPPWRVPDILAETDYLFALEVDEPIPSFSNTVMEALVSGVKVVSTTSAEVMTARYGQGLTWSTPKAEGVSSPFPLSVKIWSANSEKSILVENYRSYVDTNLEVIR